VVGSRPGEGKKWGSGSHSPGAAFASSIREGGRERSISLGLAPVGSGRPPTSRSRGRGTRPVGKRRRGPSVSRTTGSEPEKDDRAVRSAVPVRTSLSRKRHRRRDRTSTSSVGTSLGWCLPPHHSRRPQFRRDYPLNLSILIRGGKETNKDSVSSGERTRKSPALNPPVRAAGGKCSVRERPFNSVARAASSSLP